jgi:hypothetical protein
MNVHIRQTRHEESAPAIDSLRTFRNASASRWPDCDDPTIFRNYGLVGCHMLGVHRDDCHIDECDGALLRQQQLAREKNGATKRTGEE